MSQTACRCFGYRVGRFGYRRPATRPTGSLPPLPAANASAGH
ncbi:hypothetical protein [uncultured Hymenobacter sp.]